MAREHPLRVQTIRRAGWLLAAMSFIAVVAPTRSQPASAGRPNVLLVLLDDRRIHQGWTFDVAEDSASPVGDYAPPFRFTGTLERLELRADPPAVR